MPEQAFRRRSLYFLRPAAADAPPAAYSRGGNLISTAAGSGRGKEAGPALNPLKGSSAFLPLTGLRRRTRKTKLNAVHHNELVAWL
jgi:hypothetical protein